MSRRCDGQTFCRNERKAPTFQELPAWISGGCDRGVDPQESTSRRADGGRHQQYYSGSASVSSSEHRTNLPGWMLQILTSALVRSLCCLALSLSSSSASQKDRSAAKLGAVFPRDACFSTESQLRRARACQPLAIKIQHQTGFHNGGGSRKWSPGLRHFAGRGAAWPARQEFGQARPPVKWDSSIAKAPGGHR